MAKNEIGVVLGTADVGLGHTYYLQTLEPPLRNEGVRIGWLEARSNAKWLVNKLIWTGVDTLYKQGSNPDWRNTFYEWTRARSNRNSIFLKLPQAEIRHALEGFNGLYISAHAHTSVKTEGPLVVLQGDFYGGKDYAVPEAELIVVPTTISRDELVAYGIDPDKIEIVGFFSDTRIKNPAIRANRVEQLEDHTEKHVGLYLTGARSPSHVQLFEKFLSDLTPMMKQKRTKVTIYTVNDATLANYFLEQGMSHDLHTVRFSDDSANGNWDLQIVHGDTAREANDRALSVLGDPENPVSILVTMVGERLSWAADVALAPVIPFNKINAGGNTTWGVERGFFEPPSATEQLPERLRKGETIIFKEGMQRAHDEMNTDGAENTVRVIKERGLLKKAV